MLVKVFISECLYLSYNMNYPLPFQTNRNSHYAWARMVQYIYIYGSQKYIAFFSLGSVILANSADPDEKQHYVVFYHLRKPRVLSTKGSQTSNHYLVFCFECTVYG